MDTRRLTGSDDRAQAIALAPETDVEVVELTAPRPSRKRFIAPALFVIGALVLILLIAYVGTPGRSDFSLTGPLPNVLSQENAP